MSSLRKEITRTFLRLSRQSRRFRAESPETMLRPGPREAEQFGAYRIIRRLGSGGMGQVYLALDTRLGRHVALKFLPPELTNDEAMLHRLQQEARTASALNHPNILTIYEIGQLDGEHFIASEYIDGVTLRGAFERGAIDTGTAIEVAAQVASALMAAHAAGVVHRDLKPSNIMIRSDGYVKVIDFGIAKRIGSAEKDASLNTSWTRPGSVVGTLDYMSPEQARGADLDHRTDLWSLGVILYEMVARQRPFDGETESHIVVAILDKATPPLPNQASLPNGLSGIIYRALAKDPAERYQTADAMLADLRRTRQASGLVSDIRPTPRLPRPRVQRKLAWTAEIFALVAVAWAVWWWGFQGKEVIFGPNWFQFDSTKRVTFDGDVHLSTISPDGAYLAYVSGNEENETLRIRQLPNGSESRLPVTLNTCIGITFSPDSKALYYVLKDPKDVVGMLYTFRIPEDIPSLVLEDLDGPITFSPDGQQFAYLRRSERKGASGESIIVAQARNARNGRPVVEISNTEIKDQIAWSPRGDSIAAVVFAEQLNTSTQPAVSLFTLEGRLKRQFPAADFRTLAFPVWMDHGSLLVFSGLPQGSKQMRLEQLLVSSGSFHEVPSDILGFDSISATRDSQTLAAVRLDLRSSIWIADSNNLDNARMAIPPAEGIESLAWSNGGDLIFPSARSGNANLWQLGSDGAMRQIPGGKACVEDQPSAVPGQSKVVYSSNCAGRGDDFNLWSAELKSGRRTRLTSGSNYDYQPDVSPDGKWIVYTSWPSSVPSVWKIQTTGGAPVRISKHLARYPAVSPDGKPIACQIREPDGMWRVAILSFDDGSIQQEFPALPITGPVHWSPDGSALDYISSGGKVPNIWRQSLGGGPPRQMTHIAEDGIIYFAWSRNGSKLAYIRGRAESDAVLFYRSSRR